jgi:hypothetical protein
MLYRNSAPTILTTIMLVNESKHEVEHSRCVRVDLSARCGGWKAMLDKASYYVDTFEPKSAIPVLSFTSIAN